MEQVITRASVVIPTFNGLQYVARCLKSLAAAGFPDAGEVILVDDGSTDGTAGMVGREFPWVTVLPGSGDLWWSGSVNLGVKHALNRGAEHILLLNNDNTVEPGFLQHLLNVVMRKPKSIAGSVVYFEGEDRLLRYAGGRFSWLDGSVRDTRYRQSDDGSLRDPFPAEWLGGMGVLVPSALFREVGLFDADAFPQYWGDQDLWLRAIQHGYRIWVCPQSHLWVDDENSGAGLVLSNGVGKFARTLFDRRFHANLPATVRFYMRHCPVYALPTGLSCHLLRNAFRWINKSKK